jgi:hypothetical protein
VHLIDDEPVAGGGHRRGVVSGLRRQRPSEVQGGGRVGRRLLVATDPRAETRADDRVAVAVPGAAQALAFEALEAVEQRIGLRVALLPRGPDDQLGEAQVAAGVQSARIALQRVTAAVVVLGGLVEPVALARVAQQRM